MHGPGVVTTIVAVLALCGIGPALANTIEMTGLVTSCDPDGCNPDFPVDTPSFTRFIFNRNAVDPEGRHSYPIAALHGDPYVEIGADSWTEENDFRYWNDITPATPTHGWRSPIFIFEDGLLVGISFFEPDGLSIGYSGGFSFAVHASWPYSRRASWGTLSTGTPRYVPEPSSLASLGLGLVGLLLAKKPGNRVRR